MSEQDYYREGRITIIEGPQRSGKTLAMSILALDEFTNQKSEVLTNIAYENPETKEVKIPYKPLNFFELTMEKIDGFRNRAITIDELNFYLDSRASTTKINRRFCQWLLQSKKMGINTYGTTHNLYYLDLRFRENFDFLVQPTCYFDANSKTPNRPIMLVMKWFNGPNQANFKRTVKINFLERPNLLGMYNSRNVFNPFAEIEAEMEKEKELKKSTKKRAQTPLQKLVPDYVPVPDHIPVPDFLKKNLSVDNRISDYRG